MTQFWILAAVLVTAIAALIIVPLVIRRRESSEASSEAVNLDHYQEQLADIELQVEQGGLAADQAAILRRELEKNLIEDVETSDSGQLPERLWEEKAEKNFALGLVMALLVPLVSIPLYFKLGAHTELDIAEMLMTPEVNQKELVTKLETWSEKQPENTQALYLLGGRYLAQGRADEAILSFRKLYSLSPESSQAAAQLAQALFLTNGNQVTDEVRRLFAEALTLDENNTTALGLQGIDAFEQSRYAQAVSAWSRALAVEADPVARQSLAAGISRAREMLGEPRAEVRVKVELAPELNTLPGDTRVIVFARESGGAKMPLAAVPMTVSDLPREVVLDDSTAMMMGGASLSNVSKLDIIARITLSGDAANSDFEAEARAVSLTDSSVVQLMIRPAG